MTTIIQYTQRVAISENPRTLATDVCFIGESGNPIEGFKLALMPREFKLLFEAVNKWQEHLDRKEMEAEQCQSKSQSQKDPSQVQALSPQIHPTDGLPSKATESQ